LQNGFQAKFFLPSFGPPNHAKTRKPTKIIRYVFYFISYLLVYFIHNFTQTLFFELVKYEIILVQAIHFFGKLFPNGNLFFKMVKKKGLKKISCQISKKYLFFICENLFSFLCRAKNIPQCFIF